MYNNPPTGTTHVVACGQRRVVQSDDVKPTFRTARPRRGHACLPTHVTLQRCDDPPPSFTSCPQQRLLADHQDHELSDKTSPFVKYLFFVGVSLMNIAGFGNLAACYPKPLKS